VPLSRNLGALNSWNPLRHSRPITGLFCLLQEKEYDLDLNADGKMMTKVLSSPTPNVITVAIYAICFGRIDLPQALKYTILKFKIKFTCILNL